MASAGGREKVPIPSMKEDDDPGDYYWSLPSSMRCRPNKNGEWHVSVLPDDVYDMEKGGRTPIWHFHVNLSDPVSTIKEKAIERYKQLPTSLKDADGGMEVEPEKWCLRYFSKIYGKLMWKRRVDERHSFLQARVFRIRHDECRLLLSKIRPCVADDMLPVIFEEPFSAPGGSDDEEDGGTMKGVEEEVLRILSGNEKRER